MIADAMDALVVDELKRRPRRDRDGGESGTAPGATPGSTKAQVR